jgi:hypothetical protein
MRVLVLDIDETILWKNSHGLSTTFCLYSTGDFVFY